MEAQSSDSVDDVAPPAIVDGVPDKCLVCTVSGDWGHFRRIDRTVTKQTYRLPPRTTVAGLLAAIVGVGRDEYYGTFQPDVSAIGIGVVGELRTVTHPSLGLGTNPSETFEHAGGTGRKTVQVNYPDSTDNRQIHSYEYVVNPGYRLYIAVEDPEFYNSLRTHLDRGTTHYTPSLGLSELLANVDTPNWNSGPELDVEPVEAGEQASPVEVNSAVPNAAEALLPRPGSTHYVERLPGVMERSGDGRRTTEFVDYAFTEADSLQLDPTATTDLALGQVGDRMVAFY